MSFLSSAGLFTDIPDSEDFEHNDLTGFYGGATGTGTFAIQTGTVFEGTYALKSDNTTTDMIVRNNGPFSRGFAVDYQIYIESDTSSEDESLVFPTGVFSDRSNMTGYSAYHFGDGNSLILRKFTNGSLDKSANGGVSYQLDAWNNFTIEVNQSEIIFEPDGAAITLTDGEFSDLYYGFTSFSGTVYWDDLVFTAL